jgi:hypothetical protein
VKTNNQQTRQDILNRFYSFFIESGQSIDDVNTNYSDLQRMPLNQLIQLSINFNI